MYIFSLTELRVTVDPYTDTCRAGGVEISGLHATVAPKRQVQHSPPTIEEFTFVPYNENDLLSQDSTLKQYSDVCARFTKYVLSECASKFTEFRVPFPFEDAHPEAGVALDSEIEPYLQKSGFGYLQGLKRIADLKPSGMFASEVNEILQEGCKDDVLFQGLLQGRHLKNALDVVWENTRALKLKLLEVGGLDGQLYTKAIHLLHSQPTTEIDYAIADVSKEKMDSASEELDALHIKSHVWDVTSTPTNGLTGADLVLVNGLTRLTSDLDTSLSNMNHALKEGGFLLLHDVTNSQSAGGINLLPFKVRSITSEEEYLSAFKANGFEVISIKRSGILTTLFLCRKVTPEPKGSESPYILNIDDNTFSWVTELKEKMVEFESKPSRDRIWLLSDKAYHSGIVGLTNCLKQEQGGERIR